MSFRNSSYSPAGSAFVIARPCFAGVFFQFGINVYQPNIGVNTFANSISLLRRSKVDIRCLAKHIDYRLAIDHACHVDGQSALTDLVGSGDHISVGKPSSFRRSRKQPRCTRMPKGLPAYDWRTAVYG